MGFIRLVVCITGVYAAFLLWAIAQERLSSPFPSTLPTPKTQSDPDIFPSPLFLNFAQAVASSLSACLYLLFGALNRGDLQKKSLVEILGFNLLFNFPRYGSSKATPTRALHLTNGHSATSGTKELDEKNTVTSRKENGDFGSQVEPSNGVQQEKTEPGKLSQRRINELGQGRKTLMRLLLQVSICQTLAGPIGFMALRHISYPTMVLGKSCKLVPVMLLNVILYRRRFSAHKYVVVGLVTVGISMFMLLAPSKAKGRNSGDSIWGLALLLINLLIDGITNSTQDQIFSSHPLTGQQMMLHMSLFSQILLLPPLLLPLPSHPSSLLRFIPSSILHRLPPLSSHHLSPSFTLSPPAILSCLRFLHSHPTSLPPLLAYALLGGLGQLFIFETIQHFGSLTLVMLTVTRKLFTMLLSVVVFHHRLAWGQWLGVGVVFAGIGVEAGMKRREMVRRAKRD
ncbi:solute carrier family 35 (UDP-galactose transporter), member B1 [Tremella mesenterica]|uniref:UDP-galactose transporter homolog 1 n=1 Tax=Tremella mesenterica TaxID=5217 RepID=A0A4Q1BJB9_TREME|nr:solute carrier family 35 (UDP-galactose transporter), member B1 [Tremella mesenterica]